tara:strand:+ start:675 stop:1730 length:1056 start_codon:yes stop_codon:yes gene_type:complete
MKSKTILVSHNFNPGHYSHLIASKKLFIELGFEVFSRVHDNFDRNLGFNLSLEPISFYKCLSLSKKDNYLIWFPSIKAFFEALLLNCFSKVNIIYVYHEPYVSISYSLNSGYSFSQALIIQIKLFVSFFISRLSSKVIMPSNKAFSSIYKPSSKFSKINLSYDKRIVESTSINRLYFSYIGTIAEDHAFKDYIEFIVKYYEVERSSKIKFLIASKNKIPKKYDDLLRAKSLKNNVDIRCGKILSDEEIDSCFRMSKVTWNAYKKSMQSGVLATSYMNGTPVLISSNNKSEFFSNKYNGIEISSCYSFNEILDAYNFIDNNLEDISLNCINSFDTFFYYKSHKKNYLQLLNQ